MFINEYSLHEQYHDVSEFEESVKLMVLLVQTVKDRAPPRTLYKSELMENYRAIGGQDFRASLNKIRDLQIRENFVRIVYDRSNSIVWQTEQKHNSDDKFRFAGEDVGGTSMAELAERKMDDLDLACALLNFMNSPIPGQQTISIVKNERDNADLLSFSMRRPLDEWLDSVLDFFRFEYPHDAQVPPRDRQTILRDGLRFEATNETRQGRRVYRELTTRYFWYVDNRHFGPSAHLEVFDKRGGNLGRADLGGNIIPGTREENRAI